jgi:hypothetical protein
MEGGKSGQRAIGVLETRQSSPFKEISKIALTALKIPMSRQGQTQSKIPNSAEFLKCSTTTDFQNLEGKDGNYSSNNLSKKFNSF